MFTAGYKIHFYKRLSFVISGTIVLKFLLMAFSVCFFSNVSNAQVVINTNGNSPDN